MSPTRTGAPVNIAPRYLGRGSWLARRDPRVLILASSSSSSPSSRSGTCAHRVRSCWSLVGRLLPLRRDPVRDSPPELGVRRSCSSVLVVREHDHRRRSRSRASRRTDLHVSSRCRCSARRSPPSRSSYAITQFMRYLAMATIGFPLAFAIAPADFGVTFRRLGVPEKFAFGIDLTFRFLPSLARRLPDDRSTPSGSAASTGTAGAAGSSAVPPVDPGRRADRRSTRSPAPRTPSTRWTCGRSGRGIEPGSASS